MQSVGITKVSGSTGLFECSTACSATWLEEIRARESVLGSV